MKIHWFAITIYQTHKYVVDLWSRFFALELGDFVHSPRGGRGFQNIDVALQEAKLYYNPAKQLEGGQAFCHLEFTGSACDCVIPSHFKDLVECLKSENVLFKVTRLDIAFDNLPFTPSDFYQQIYSGNAKTPVKLNSQGNKNNNFSIICSPFELRDDGQVGTDTCYLGSKSSNRFIRVYNKRGFTRLELVCRDERANAVALDIFQNQYQDWHVVACGHLLDYLDFSDWSLWQDFIKHAKPADLIITPARKVSLIKIHKWLERQVMVALSVFYDVHGWKIAQSMFDRMLFEAITCRDRSRYKAVLQLKAPFEDLANLRVPDTHNIDFDLDDMPMVA